MKDAKDLITPVRVADLVAEGELLPVYVHVIDHPGGRVLVDTGLTQLHPAVADMDPRLRPRSEWELDLDGIDIVVNTHLHFDHCGGNHLFTGKPIYVQRRELDDARSTDDYTIRDWVEAPGVQYVSAGPGARPHARIAGGRRRDGWASGRRRRRHGGVVRGARRAEHRRSADRARDGARAGLVHARARAVATRHRVGARRGPT